MISCAILESEAIDAFEGINWEGRPCAILVSIGGRMELGARPRLARFAMQVGQSRGRRYPEPSHPYRNDFERDRDRIVHARAFRRLENKTQVFARRHSDHFRNRLTHTLEVAQISRTVALSLGLNTDLVEALALVHDVGHPPFGHAGELLLDSLMQGYGERFDHNLHALRIVEELEQKYVRFPGLNLTFEVREGIIKHSRQYNGQRCESLAEYLLDRQPPLEAQLIDLADEIAYNCADLDDGYEAKLLDLKLIRDGVPIFDSVHRKIDRRHPAALEKLKFNEAVKCVLNRLVSELIGHSRERIRKAGLDSVDSVRDQSSRLMSLSPSAAKANRQLKVFLQTVLYDHEDLKRERHRAVKRVKKLFQYYLAHPRSMSRHYIEKSRSEPHHRVVCDYIAGMTDNFLVEQYLRRLG